MRGFSSLVVEYVVRNKSSKLWITGDIRVRPKVLLTPCPAIVDDVSRRIPSSTQYKQIDDVFVELWDRQCVLDGCHPVDDVGQIPVVVHALTQY